MLDWETKNAIYTAKIVYFLKCAKEQNYTLDMLVSYVSEKFNISGSCAIYWILKIAPMYFEHHAQSCLEFIDEKLTKSQSTLE